MLCIVPTPIGNLRDITLRGIDALQRADVIICEDSRVTRKLLKLLNIETKPRFVDYLRNHVFNTRAIEAVFTDMRDNSELEVTLVSDAGTPGVSDPVVEVIHMCHRFLVPFTVLPGATAFVPAIVASGFAGREFVFKGFLPIKKGRKTEWLEIAQSNVPVVLYESVHRIEKFIAEAQIYLEQGRGVCIARELTKTFETVWVGQVKDIASLELITKGEFAVVIQGVKRKKSSS
jgi:16S rRNA (cytidine1402-2'-O)-methyltransferase